MRRDEENNKSFSNMVTFYHDIEQNAASDVEPEDCCHVVKEFLKLEKKYNVPATYNVLGKIFQQQLDLIESITDAGQEVAFHSFNHQSDWCSKYYSNEVDLCRRESSLPYGYRSPKSQYDRSTLKSLWDNNFIWSAEWDTHKEPYFIYKGLVRLPIADDDWELYKGRITKEDFINKFSKLLHKRHYFAIGFHDYTVSIELEKFLTTYENLLQIAKEKNVLLVNFFQAADLYRRAAVSQYYSQRARIWNRNTQNLYRTKRFKEIIREQTEQLNQPIIADLGSGGGVLTSHLTDIAEKIYCVDNAPGMVEEANENSGIQAILGEITETNLPDNSMDLIICARVIEYVSSLGDLAEEIKRIGKEGSTYMMTFPAYRDDRPYYGNSPPDKIRHYFTAEEIQEWADQIGPGRFVGVQYKRQKPSDLETENAYREIEENQPQEEIPTNWVYIGNVTEKYNPNKQAETVPLSAFEFQFYNQNIDNLISYVKKLKNIAFKSIRTMNKKNRR